MIDREKNLSVAFLCFPFSRIIFTIYLLYTIYNIFTILYLIYPASAPDQYGGDIDPRSSDPRDVPGRNLARNRQTVNYPFQPTKPQEKLSK